MNPYEMMIIIMYLNMNIGQRSNSIDLMLSIAKAGKEGHGEEIAEKIKALSMMNPLVGQVMLPLELGSVLAMLKANGEVAFDDIERRSDLINGDISAKSLLELLRGIFIPNSEF